MNLLRSFFLIVLLAWAFIGGVLAAAYPWELVHIDVVVFISSLWVALLIGVITIEFFESRESRRQSRYLKNAELMLSRKRMRMIKSRNKMKSLLRGKINENQD